MPSRVIRRSSVRTVLKGPAGRARRCGFSSAKCSTTIRPVVACRRGLATLSSHCWNWAFRSSRLRKERPRKKFLTDVAEGTLDLALGLGAVGLAGLGHEAVVHRQVEEFGVVDDAALVDLAQHGGLHAIIQDLRRDAAQRLEGGDMAAQHRRQVLALDEAGPHQAAVAKHQGKQPDDPLSPRLVGEGDPKVSEIDLGLFARWGLEAALEPRRGPRPDGAKEILQRGVAADIAALLDLPEQATAVEIGKGGDPLAQIGFDRGDDSRPRVTRTIARRFQAAFNVFGNGRTIHPGAPGDRGEGEALPMKIQDHYEFPECDHRRTSLPISMGRMVHDRPTSGADTLEVGLLGHLRDFTAPDLSSIHPASTTFIMRPSRSA